MAEKNIGGDMNSPRYLDEYNPHLDLTVSEHKKRKNDYDWAKYMMDYFMTFDNKSPEDLEKYDERWELHRGSWSKLEKYEEDLSFKYEGQEYGIKGLKMRHFPIINRVSMNILGGIISNPLITMVKDFSPKSKNYRERQKLEFAQNYAYDKLVKPRIQKIQQEFLQEIGEEAVENATPEQQQAIQQELGNRIDSLVPEDLKMAIDTQLSPEERIGQKFLEHFVKEEKVNEKFSLGAEDAVVNAEEYYRINIINGKPRMEVLNSKYVDFGGSEHVEFCEDATYAKYEQYLTPQDVIQKYGKHLVKKDIKELETLFNNFTSGGYNRSQEQWENLSLTEYMADNPAIEDFIRSSGVYTKEGQDKLKYLYAKVGGLGGGNHRNTTYWGIRETYVTWKWLRHMKMVTRVINGKEVEVFKDHHYKKNASKGDIKIKEIMVPQVWHGVTLGETGSDLKIMVEPFPYQYNSLKDPFDVKLPIFGCKFNTHRNNTKNISFIDLGMPFQFEYNSLKRDWEKFRRTNIGKVLLGTVNMIPDNMSPGDFYGMLQNLKLGLVSDKYEGKQGRGLEGLKGVDLSQGQEMLEVLKDMEMVKEDMYEAMYFNKHKLGQGGQYSTATQTQVNVQAVDAQLSKFHDKRRQIKERVLLFALNLTIAAYHDDDDKKAQVLDDMSIAYLETNYEFLSITEWAVHVVDDYKESRRLEQVRMQIQAFIQNGATTKDIIAIMRASSLSELQEIAERIDKKKEEQVNKQRQHESSMIDKQNQYAQKLAEFQQNKEDVRKQAELDASIKRAELSAQQMERAADINQNNIADSTENARAKLSAEERMKQRELEYKRWETLQKLRDK